MLFPFPIFSADIEFSAPEAAGSAEIRVSVSDIDYDEFLKVLEQGYSSEIIYSFRIRNKRFLSALTAPSGRSSWSVTKIAYKEFLTDMYLIDIEGESSAYQSDSDFINAFFSCSIPVPEDFTGSGDNVLEVKATADLITRPAPLSLLDPFFRSEITETGWFRIGD